MTACGRAGVAAVRMSAMLIPLLDITCSGEARLIEKGHTGRGIVGPGLPGA